MVFPDDLKWKHDYLTATGRFYDDHSAIASPRFRSWGTEELLIRCIRKNMPWIRTIYIILARQSQMQSWIRDYLAGKPQGALPQVKMVLHKDFMPKETLPTFNSRAIEMYLHRIPGLSEYFIYANDDMFPVSPLCADDFFRSRTNDDGTIILPCQQHKEKPYPSQPNNFHRACLCGLNFVAEEFGLRFDKTWLHGGHSVTPIVKKTCLHLWGRGGKNIERSVTPFRTICNYNQYIYAWYQHLSGQYINHAPSRRYVSTKNTINDILTAIRKTDGVLCINDNEAVSNVSSYASAVREELLKRIEKL